MSELNIKNSNKKSSDVHQSFSFLSDLDRILLRNILQSSALKIVQKKKYAQVKLGFDEDSRTGFCYATSFKAPL